MTTRASVSVQSFSWFRHSSLEATMEALDEAVLPRAARIDVNGLDAIVRQPALHLLGDELRAVVATQESRCPNAA